MIDLLVGFLETLKFNHIKPDSIGEVETNQGVIWFEVIQGSPIAYLSKRWVIRGMSPAEK